jgi:very-short-patch-repair endonuclease
MRSRFSNPNPKHLVLATILDLLGVKYKTEHKFHPVRRWRFDYAIPSRKIAIEYEGVFGGRSRHTSVVGYAKDCEKYNHAAMLGWRVYRFTARDFTKRFVETTTNFLKEALCPSK